MLGVRLVVKGDPTSGSKLEWDKRVPFLDLVSRLTETDIVLKFSVNDLLDFLAMTRPEVAVHSRRLSVFLADFGFA